jgi:hypothetical protein
LVKLWPGEMAPTLEKVTVMRAVGVKDERRDGTRSAFLK